MSDSTAPRHPVFVVGMSRSGTSLLSAMLNAHSQLAMSPETHYFTRCWDGPVQGRAHASELVDCLLRQPGIGDMRLTTQEVRRVRSAVAEQPTPTHRDILEALLIVYLGREGKPYWGEKTPGHWKRVPVIHETFPDAVFLAIVRDPRDVSLSLRKVPWNQRRTVIDHAREWKQYARVSERYKATFPFKEIQYEALLTHPEEVIRDVLDFLGFPYEPHVGDFYKEGAQHLDPAREPWKAKAMRPVDPSNRNNWVDEMSRVERKIIQQVCGSAMEQKGYRRETIPWRVSMVPTVARLLWKTVTGRLHRLRATPWYLRPEATATDR